MKTLPLSKPTRFYELDPAIIAEDCRNESLHLFIDRHIRISVSLNGAKQGVLLIDFGPELSTIVILGVYRSELGSDSNGPVQLPFDLTHLLKVLLSVHLEHKILLLEQNDDVLHHFDEPSMVNQV